jgi:fatty-acyl-CoA synthase
LYPSEIEKFLRTHPSVLDCYVIGVPDERFGEELCAWIKLKSEDQNKISEQSIKEFCKGNIAHFKIPKHIKFVDGFPINATAKIQKFKMVEQMKKELNIK